MLLIVYDYTHILLSHFTKNYQFNWNNFTDQIWLSLHTFNFQFNSYFHIYQDYDSHRKYAVPTRTCYLLHNLRCRRTNIEVLIMVLAALVLGTHFSSQKVDYWLDGVDFVSSQSGFYSVSLNLRGHSALLLLEDINLTFNIPSMIIKRYN